MTKEEMWMMFKLTGKIEYYLRYKKLEEGSLNVKETRGNNN